MEPLNYEVRALSRREIPDALSLWKETSYPEGKHSVDTWYEVDNQGFWIAVTDEGEVIGVCCAVFNDEDTAHVGIYAVKKKYRGKGIGLKVWAACLEHIGDRNAVVNAVPGKMEAYRDIGGFPIVEAGWHSYHYHIDEADPSVLLKEVDGVDLKMVIDEKDVELVLDYDAAILGYKREKIVKLSLEEAESASLVAVENGTCVGYGILKLTCQDSVMVGPLYADNQDVAEIILRRLIESLPSENGLDMMVININQGGQSIIDKLQPGLEGMEVPRLYRKYKVNADISKVYGHFNLNFAPY